MTRPYPVTVEGTLKRPGLKKIIKNRLLEIAFQFFVSAFLGRYPNFKKNKSPAGARLKKTFCSKLAARALDVLAGVRLDFLYILFELSWSAVSIRTGAASYKWSVQVSPIFSAFTESFLELLRVYFV